MRAISCILVILAALCPGVQAATPSPTPTPTPTGYFNASAEVVPEAATVVMGQPFQVTVNLLDSSVGCYYAGYDLTLSQTGPGAPAFVPSTEVVGPPAPGSHVFNLTAFSPGTVTFHAAYYGENNCSGGWSWAFVQGDSIPVTVLEPTPTPMPTPDCPTPAAYHAPGSGALCAPGDTMRQPEHPSDPAEPVCISLGINDTSFYWPGVLHYRVGSGSWSTHSLPFACFQNYYNVYWTGCGAPGTWWVPGGAAGQTVEYYLELQDSGDCTFYLHGEESPGVTQDELTAQGSPYWFRYPPETPSLGGWGLAGLILLLGGLLAAGKRQKL